MRVILALLVNVPILFYSMFQPPRCFILFFFLVILVGCIYEP